MRHDPKVFIPKIKELASQGLTTMAIANVLKETFENAPTRMTIVSWVKKFNIPVKTKEDYDKQRYDEVLELLKSGARTNEIRERGYSHELIAKVSREQKLERPGRAEAAEDRALSKEEVLERLPKDQKYEYLGREYGKYKIMAEDGTIFYKSATRLHQGQPKAGAGVSVSESDFLARMLDAGYKIIEGSYSARREPGIIECKNGHQRKVAALTSILYNRYVGCNQCNGGKTESEQELDFANFVKSLDPEAKKSSLSSRLDGAQKGPLPSIDIYSEKFKVGFEYCGVYWHKDDGDDSQSNNRTSPRSKKRLKREVAESEGKRLFFIYSTEWLNKRPIVESTVRARMGAAENIIFARKCHIRSIPQAEAHSFLNENHIMGPKFGSSYLGLFYGDDLVSVLSYSKKSDGGVEIDRFCTKLNTIAIGALSKMLKYIERLVQPNYFISFVDLRHGDGHSLLKLGFVLKGISTGFMWTDGNSTFDRHKCRANMDSRKLSEAQYAQEMGLSKIYDSGQAKFYKQLK